RRRAMRSGPPPAAARSSRPSITASCSSMSSRLRANAALAVSRRDGRGAASRVGVMAADPTAVISGGQCYRLAMTSEQTEPSSSVRVEVADGVATVTLADEANRNAMGRRMVAGLLDALAAANADPAVRVVVLTNEGRIFSAGADLSEQSAGGDPAGSEDEPGGEAAAGRGFEDLLRAILDSPTPVVGRIDGHAVGGGVGLVAACDIAIARDDVLLGFTEVRVGVFPAMISVVCLPKMRRADALEVFLRGNRFPASRAAELGLVTRAVPAGELDDAVAEVVADLRLGAP